MPVAPITKRRGRACLLLLLLLAGMVIGPPLTHADDNRFGFTTDFGLLRGAPDGTHFAMSLGVDYYVDSAFSVGVMSLLTPASSLNTYSLAGVTKYHLHLDRITLVPFAGLGFMHMQLEKAGSPSIDDSSTSYWIPLGISGEVPVSPGIALSTTLLVNLHRMHLAPIPRDHASLAILFGVHFGP